MLLLLLKETWRGFRRGFFVQRREVFVVNSERERAKWELRDSGAGREGRGMWE